MSHRKASFRPIAGEPGRMAGFGDQAKRFGPLYADATDSRSGFQDWLSVFFISRGHYTLTDAGIERFGGESPSSEERRATAGRTIDEMVRRGEAEGLYREKLVARRPHLDWQAAAVRVSAVKKLIECLGKAPSELEFDDMRLNGLSGLMNRYRNSPYLALTEAGYAHPMASVLEHSAANAFDSSKLYPWQLVRAGSNLYRDREIRIAAVKWLHSICGKEAKLITCDDFGQNRLIGLLDQKYSGSPYRALAEAGLAYGNDDALAHAAAGAFKYDKPYPWQMDNSRIYHEKAMRRAATCWLVWKLGKPPASLSQCDFGRNGLGGLIQLPAYKGSPYAALVESGHAYSPEEAKAHSAARAFGSVRVYPWEMNNLRIYSDKLMRTGSLRWLIWRSGKDARDLTTVDFVEAGLHGLISNYYEGSPFKALYEAGEVLAREEEYMRRRGAGRFA